MFNYLYYKIYQSILTGSYRDIPHLITPIFLGGLIGINILVIYSFLVKLGVLSNFSKNATDGGWLIAFLIILFVLYFRKNKRTRILEKYSGEDENARIRGNVIVGMYVALSFISIFAVAFFRPGKF